MGVMASAKITWASGFSSAAWRLDWWAPLFIRHGEPDYEKDSLTEKGFREAEYLAEYLADVKIDACYVSPLGRAKDTAAPTDRKSVV